MNPTIAVRPVDLSDAAQAAAWLAMLDHYARDAMGGGHALSEKTHATLVPALRKVANYHGALAWSDADGRTEAVGLINCFVGFSTFAAAPLLNVHDLVVKDTLRGTGIGAQLLAYADALARELGCCKITLEVLSGNAGAQSVYRRAGYRPYQLDPQAGQALLLEKKL